MHPLVKKFYECYKLEYKTKPQMPVSFTFYLFSMPLGPNNLQRTHLISVEKRCNLHNHSDFSVLLETVHLDSYKSCLQNIAER